jgi:hypothetical protein
VITDSTEVLIFTSLIFENNVIREIKVSIVSNAILWICSNAFCGIKIGMQKIHIEDCVIYTSNLGCGRLLIIATNKMETGIRS